MLRRLHALGAKDPAGQLLRSLSSRRTNATESSHLTSSTDESTLVQAQRSSSGLGAIGPASTSRLSFNSPNRGLSGLAGTGFWSGNDAMGAGWGSGVRSFTAAAETNSQR